MRKQFLEWYSRFVFDHRIGVLAATILITLLAGLACLGLEFHTSRDDLSLGDSPEEIAFDAFIEEFGTANYLLVVVEPSDAGVIPSREAYGRFVDDLEERLLGETDFFEAVYARVDLAAFENHAPADALGGMEVQAVREIHDLADANRTLARGIREGLRAGDLDAAEEPAAALRGLLHALRWEESFLEAPRAAAGSIDLMEQARRQAPSAGSGQGVSPEGYLTSYSGEHYFLIAQPTSSTSDLEFVNPMIAAARAQIAAAEEAQPGLRAGLTGLPAMIQEEMAAVRRDTIFTTSVAIVGIVLLSMTAFHRRRLAPFVLISLGMGVIWAAGLIALTIGYLNLITSSFAAILIGLGIDFGVHVVSQYEIETAHGKGCREAIGGAIRKTGAGLTAGAATTAAAFFSITLMEYPGFAQLGFVGGFGILLCLGATFTALPAMLCIEGTRRNRGRSQPRSSQGARLERGDRISRGVLRFPRAILAAGLIVTVWLGFEAWRVGFDRDIQSLLPLESESLRLQETVLSESELSADFNVLMADDLDELARLQATYPQAASIARRESILTYLPRDAAERGPVIEAVRDGLERLRVRHRAPEPATYARKLGASLEELAGALEEVEEVAFATGRGELLATAGEALAALAGAREQVVAAPPGRPAAWIESEERLFEEAGALLERLREIAANEPPELEDLPESLRTRFIGRTGKYLLYLYPDGKIAETGAGERFNRDCRAIDPAVTGYPILVQDGTREITEGFGKVVLVGALLIVLALLIDFRHAGYAFLAAATTGLGILWTLGWMGMAGQNFNLANLPTMPLVLGAGVAYGIHLLHRYRQEAKEGLATVLHHTGRAMLISALTTMIGFGSLALASHRGIASLGRVLLIGIASCFVAAAILLPCLLQILRDRRSGSA